MINEPAPPYERGFTYFIQDGDAIKIGTSGAPALRLQTLQVSTSHELKMLAVVPTMVAEEGACHSRFAHLRIRGEWFRAAPELFAFIDQLKGEAPAAIRAAAPIKIPNPLGKMRGALIKRRRIETDPRIVEHINILIQQIDNRDAPGMEAYMSRTMAELSELTN